MAEQLAGEASVVQVDTEANRALAARFGVRGVPVTFLLKGGKVVDQLPGAHPASAVIAWFRRPR